MSHSRKTGSKCHHKSGCRRRAVHAGYCDLHKPSYQFPLLDTTRAARDRVLDIVVISENPLALTKLIEFCIQYKLLNHLEIIFEELLEPVIEILSTERRLDEVRDASGKKKIQALLAEWYKTVPPQELQYRLYHAFEFNHDLFYNFFIDQLRSNEELRALFDSEPGLG